MRFADFIKSKLIVESLFFDRDTREIKWYDISKMSKDQKQKFSSSPDFIGREEIKPLRFSNFPGDLYSSFRYRAADSTTDFNDPATQDTDVASYQLDVLRALKGRAPTNHLFNFTISQQDKMKVLEKCAGDIARIVADRNVSMIVAPSASRATRHAGSNGLVGELLDVFSIKYPALAKKIIVDPNAFQKRAVYKNEHGEFSYDDCLSFVDKESNSYQVALKWYMKKNPHITDHDELYRTAEKQLDKALVSSVRTVLNRHSNEHGESFLKITDVWNQHSMKLGNLFIDLNDDVIKNVVISSKRGNVLIIDDSVTTGSSLVSMYKHIKKHMTPKHEKNSRMQDIIAYVMFTALQNPSKKSQE